MNPTAKVALSTGKFLALVKEARWEYVDRIGANGAAIIVAVTDGQKLLLVEQYRIPVHARTIELPAGIIGDEPGGCDESHAEAAKRELSKRPVIPPNASKRSRPGRLRAA